VGEEVKVLFVLPAETIYDQQGRVMGWKQTPSPRAKLKQLKTLVPRLKELGAERVICSDLDGQSGWMIARTMGLRCEEWQTARRFNWGKHHGIPKNKAEKEWETLQEKWKANPDIPVHSGDSLSSFRKRIEAMKERFKKQSGTVVVVMAPFEIQNLTGVKANLERGRVYEWGVA
jgi:broad specificity phosphatase PhoE